MINKKWYPSQSPALPVQKKAFTTLLSWYKHVKDSPVHGGRIVCKVIGRTKEEAEEIAAHICNAHNSLKGKID